MEQFAAESGYLQDYDENSRECAARGEKAFIKRCGLDIASLEPSEDRKQRGARFVIILSGEIFNPAKIAYYSAYHHWRRAICR